ncbi:CU044_5270 family protein [Actinomadura atramentaria]|uniref:CU044_5270 family protein n=1 Tax=Actinomadura atramentaria TaxID=1990 RepID=UPI0003770053|nr:CU044_5270 family protein [Actinomadura atramentaria]
MRNDPLRVLAEARPDELHPDAPVDPDRRQAELSRAMLGAPASVTAPARRGVPRWGLALAGLGAAAAVAAGAVVALPGGSGPHRAPATAAPVALDARTVLLSAAEHSLARPSTAGRYWHTSVISRASWRADGGYTVVTRTRQDTWTPRTPGQEIIAVQQELGARPASPADERAWRAAGAPTRIKARTTTSGTRFKPAVLTTAQGAPERSATGQVDGDKVFWLGRNVTVKQLQALPGDPAALRKSLLAWYDGHDTESASVRQSSDQWLFRVASALVDGTMPVMPKVRAAAYRMLSKLTTVRSLGEVTDPQGRRGVGIALPEPGDAKAGTVENRLIIDPETGDALATETVLLKPGGANDALPAGAVIASSAAITTEWTNTDPR